MGLKGRVAYWRTAFWRWCLLPFLSLISVQALRKIGLHYGFAPEDWLASVVIGAPSVFWSEVFGWILVVVFAGVLLWLFEWRRRSVSQAPAADTQPISNSSSSNVQLAPGVDRFTAEEVATILSKKSGYDYTPSQVVRMFKDRGFKVDHQTETYYPPRSTAMERAFMDVTGSHERRNIYWFTRAAIERFTEGKGGRISLQEAAVKAYEATQEGSIHSLFAESYGDIETWYANWLIRGETENFCIPVYGAKPPSTQKMKIPVKHLQDGALRAQAATLETYDGSSPNYVDLEIDYADFMNRLDAIKRHFMGMQGSGA